MLYFRTFLERVSLYLNFEFSLLSLILGLLYKVNVP